ncbi:MAG: FlgD immunoglobulin-like domain containing protein [Bacteroidia bacterium]
MKNTLLLLIALFYAGYLSAQDNLTITYNANAGVSTLQGATKVYLHSGASDVSGPLDTTAWHYIIGNWGMDDGVGEMVNLGPDFWSFTMDPFYYYSLASNGPVSGSILRVGLVFRNEDGSHVGLDDNGRAIYIDISGSSPLVYNTDGTPYFGVTAGITAGITSPSSSADVTTGPNPMTNYTVFKFDLPEASTTSLSIYDQTGRLVASPFCEKLSAGKNVYTWTGTSSDGSLLSSGVYYYSINSSSLHASGRLIITR